MALIPLKDTSTINSFNASSDGWDDIPPDSTNTLKCRINESSKLVKNQLGDEVISNVQILYEGAIKINYTDKITSTDSNGIEQTMKPTAIERIKDIASKVLFTEVSL